MFELLDGRAYAYQWDTGLYVTCTGLKETDEVHFCRPGSTLAILPAMVGKTLAAPVPDELLQTADTIVIFAYTETETGGITRVEKRLGVTSRPKPPAYVYTPAEALRYKTLEERIGKLEETGEYYIPGAALDGNTLQLTFTPSQPTMPALEPTVIDFPMEETLTGHMADTANPHGVTAAQAGAAPKGHIASHYSAATNDEITAALNSAIAETANNAMRYIRIHVTANGLDLSGGSWFVEIRRYNANYCAVTARHSNSNYTAQRCLANGTWEAWAWVSPAMSTGVEYRTTEMWNGAPVYTKSVSLGTLPDSGRITVVTGISFTNFVSLEVYVTSDTNTVMLPWVSSTGAVSAAAWRSNTTIYVQTFVDASAYTGYAVLKYTKE